MSKSGQNTSNAVVRQRKFLRDLRKQKKKPCKDTPKNFVLRSQRNIIPTNQQKDPSSRYLEEYHGKNSGLKN